MEIDAGCNVKEVVPTTKDTSQVYTCKTKIDCQNLNLHNHCCTSLSVKEVLISTDNDTNAVNSINYLKNTLGYPIQKSDGVKNICVD